MSNTNSERNDRGQFVKEPRPAIFGVKQRNYVAVMESGELDSKERKGKKGHQIRFDDGRYETLDRKEYEFLKRLSLDKRPFRNIVLLQEPIFPEDIKQEEEKLKKGGKS